MHYQGWNFEKTLLIKSGTGAATRELIDVRIPVETAAAGNLLKDLRVVSKNDWNQLDRELPSQAYDLRRFGDVTTCRVAFNLDVPARGVQRVGIFYDNPAAPAPVYPTALEFRETPAGTTVKAPRYIVETDARTGMIKSIVGRLDVPNLDPRVIRCTDALQECAAVIFAVGSAGTVRPVRVSAADWTDGKVVEDIRGPQFIKRTLRGHLSPGDSLPPDHAPVLTITCKYFAEQPYFLVHTRLEFPHDTRVFGLCTGLLKAERNKFTHYTFRPVSPNLPNSEVEEMGHILIDPAHTAGLPTGNAFSGLLPYNLAWQAFINARKGSECSLAAIQLHSADRSAGTAFPYYRQSTYLERETETATCYRAPIYVKLRNRIENVITVPAGTVVENAEAWMWDLFDRDWGARTDQLGRQLNSPAQVEIHPQFMSGPVPAESYEPLPRGERAAAYLRQGVR